MDIKELNTDIEAGFELSKTLVSKFPFRSPATVPECLREYIEGKSLCDLGCAEGDMLFLMQKYAKSVIGFERDPIRYQPAIDRGINIIKGDFFETKLPIAEVYYFWGPSPELSIKLVDLIMNQSNIENCTILTHARTVGAFFVVDPVKRYNGKIVSIPYKELDAKTNEIEISRSCVGIIEKNSPNI